MSYQICKRCVLDSHIPNIFFDENGICNFCNDYDKREIPSSKKYTKSRENEFIRLTKPNKKNSYDCICLYSGGKDSSYMLYELVTKYKLKTLAFTLDHGFLSNGTFLNIKKLQSKLDFDSIIFKPSNNLVKSLVKLGIYQNESLPRAKELAYTIGNVCWPCFVLISMLSIKLAVEKQIPNLIVGTTPGQIRQKKYDLVAEFGTLTDVYQTMVLPMIKLLKMTGNEQLIPELDLSFFKKLKVLRVRLIPFYEYIAYSEEKAIRTVQDKFGWEKPVDTDSCSSNCLLNSLGIELHRKKYGISPYAIPFSRDIREGLIDREQALKAINAKLQKDIVDNVANTLDINLEEIIKNGK